MVRHIVMWNFADGFSDEENARNAQKMKAGLERLGDTIEQVKELRVVIDPLPTSNRNVMLDSRFDSEEDLTAYLGHPDHVEFGKFVRSVMKDRACVDFVE